MAAEPEEIRRALGLLIQPDHVYELRVLNAERAGTVSGYYDDPEALALDAAAWSEKAPAVYITLNPVKTDLLARSANRAGPYAKYTTGDHDILRRVRLGFDFDPKRPAGISATRAEHEAATTRAFEMARRFTDAGWPRPLIADSGNGGHVVYAVDLPNDEATRQLIEGAIRGAGFLFSDAAVVVDESVWNAARIWKLYGTPVRKGDSTVDRPHRLACILLAPGHLNPVSADQLQWLAGHVPARPAPRLRNSEQVFDLERWIDEHHIPVTRTGAWGGGGGGQRWILNPCPWDPAHTNRSAYIVRMHDGAIGAGCHHNGCQGKGWPELRALFEPHRPTRVGVPYPAPEAPPLAMPDSGLVGIARDFADLYAKYLESPRAFFYVVFLTYLGAMVARKVTLDSELRPQPRLYTVLLGESADTRKSTALRKVDEFFRSLGIDYTPPVLYGVGSAEGIAAELKDNPDLLLHFDELKAFTDKARAEHSVALPMASTLFERNDYDNRTKEQRVSVRGASLSMVAACTADTFATIFDSKFLAIGFPNRLWLVSDRSTRQIAVPTAIPDHDLEDLRSRTRACLDAVDKGFRLNHQRPVPYRLTPGALEMFRDWYAAREGSIFERRLDTYAHRLMLLLAVSAGRTCIDEDLVERIVLLLRYQLDVRREYDPVDAENKIASMEERIRRALARGALKGRDLKRKVHADRAGVWIWETAVNNLIRVQDICKASSNDLYWLARASPVTNGVTTPKSGLSSDDD